jgi:deazaflavin-dependent oxidoreductase (nitroreductase family)
MAFLRPFTTRVVNPLTRRVAGWLPGFGLLTYQGRRSGKTYRTPLNVFRRGDTFAVALTYSSDAQWVKNVLAAGEAEIRSRRRTFRLGSPQLVIDKKGRLVPLPVRLFMRLLRVSEYLTMSAQPSAPSPRTFG